MADGCYTGEMEFWAYGEAKAQKVRELALQRGYRLPDCFAYSDSVTDLPLLEAVGHPRAVNPDRALRRIARSAAGQYWSSAAAWPPSQPACQAAPRPAGSPQSRACDAMINRDNELITPGGFQVRGSVVQRSHGRDVRHGNRVPTGDQPREACRGAGPAGGAPISGAPHLPRRRRCTLGNPAWRGGRRAPRTRAPLGSAARSGQRPGRVAARSGHRPARVTPTRAPPGSAARSR